MAKDAKRAPDQATSLTVTLESSHADVAAGGAEGIGFDGGVLFSYVNINRDPTDMANAMQTALIGAKNTLRNVEMSPAGKQMYQTDVAGKTSRSEATIDRSDSVVSE